MAQVALFHYLATLNVDYPFLCIGEVGSLRNQLLYMWRNCSLQTSTLSSTAAFLSLSIPFHGSCTICILFGISNPPPKHFSGCGLSFALLAMLNVCCHPDNCDVMHTKKAGPTLSSLLWNCEGGIFSQALTRPSSPPWRYEEGVDMLDEWRWIHSVFWRQKWKYFFLKERLVRIWHRGNSTGEGYTVSCLNKS